MSGVPSLPPNDRERKIPPRTTRIPLWLKVIGWIAAGIAALLIVVVIAVAVLLRSPKIHQYALRTAQEKASAALNTPVKVRDFTLRFSGISPAVDLYDVTVQGAAPYSNTTLLQAEQIRASVRVTSVLRRTWYLNEVRIERPVARVFVDKNGVNNLPKPKSTGERKTDVFDLGIRHASITGGEVYYNDRKSVLQADLHNVQFRSAFNAGPRQYAGALSYRDGRLQFGAYNPIAHNLDAQFSATPTVFTLKRGVLSSGRTRVTLSGTAQDYSQPRVQARYDAVVDAGEFRRILKNASVPAGLIRAAGDVRYTNEPGRPMLETTTLSGHLSSDALQVRTPQYRGEVRNLAARYALADGNLEIPSLRARLLGGELTANLTMRNLGGNSQSKLQAAVRGASLAALKSMANSPAFRRVVLNGTVNADANAAWGKTFDDLVARTTATLQGGMAPAANPANAVPLNAVINARYAAPTGQLALSQSYVQMRQTTLHLDGTVSERSNLQVNVQSRDLHELETVAEAFLTSGQPLGLYGSASFVGAVSGSTKAPRIAGQLTASDVRAKGSAWRLVRAKVDVGPSRASLQDGVAQPAGRGRITFDLSAGLRRYTFTEASPVQIAVKATQINIADLLKTAGVQTPASGTLSANITMHGSQLNPVGQGRIDLTQAEITSQPIRSASLNFDGNGNQAQGKLVVRLPAGSAQGTFTVFPKQRSFEAQLSSDGIQLAQLQAVKTGNVPLSGTLKLEASGRGTFKNPELQATMQVPQLQIQNQTVNGLTLRAAVSNRIADIALDSQVVNTSLRGRGRINLTGDYQTEATLDTEAIPLQPLVAMYAPSQGTNIGGQTEVHATMRGPLKDKSRLEAHVVLPTLQLRYRNDVQIGAVDPIRIDYANGVMTLQRAALRGTGTDLQIQGRIPIVETPTSANTGQMWGTSTGSPANSLSLLVLGTLDLRLAQVFDPDLTSAGQLRFNINSFGRRSDPNVQGQVQIVNASFSSSTMPVGLQNGNGILTLTKDRLNITQFRGMVGGGTVTARGGVVYRPALRFELAMAGQDLRLLYPQEVREVVDADLTLTGTTEASLLRGLVRVDQLSFAPDFDLANFLGQFSGGISSPPGQGFAENLQLNISVQSTSGLNLVSRTLSVQGAANLRVQGTAADPVVLGRVNLNGGDVIFNDQRFVLQGGTVDFINPTRTEPVLNVAANTTIDQYNIQLRFTGPMDHMRTNYTSDPGLPQSDIINLLAFGKTTEASAANPTPGNLAAQSAIASQVSGKVTSRLEKIAGISQLSVDPLLGCNQQAKGGCITIRQRVTGQIFVTFQTDVTSAQRDTIQVEYQYTPRVSFSGTRDQNGGFGFDARIRKTW